MELRPNAMKLCRRRRRSLVVLGFFFTCLVISNIFGVFIHPFEVDFYTNFSYPLDLKNFRDIIEVIKDSKQSKDKQDSDLSHDIKEVPKPINGYNYRYIIRNQNKCSKIDANNSLIDNKSGRHSRSESLEDITLLIVVKSALNNFDARNAIRKSWGFEKRFSDVIIKRIFILGNCLDRSDIPDCQDRIDDESELNADIVEADFVDTYFNNTIKTMVAIKWVVDHCSSAQFILFVDDDYYISVKNLLKYVRNPIQGSPVMTTNSFDSDHNVFDGRLYTGYVFSTSSPLRHRPSKWFVSLEEYPYSKYPPYVTAGAFVLTNLSLIDMHFGTLYTKHFRFDDIYVGILAKKLSIIAIHCENFHFWPLSYEASKYSSVIASHGFHDTNHLLLSWNQQKSLGFA